jgi:hypothetical protein
LPPPTITLPGSPQALAGGENVAPPAAPVIRPGDPAPADPPDRSNPAVLIDRAIAALSYLWLGCGILVLAGLAVGSVWIMRRRP